MHPYQLNPHQGSAHTLHAAKSSHLRIHWEKNSRPVKVAEMQSKRRESNKKQRRLDNDQPPHYMEIHPMTCSKRWLYRQWSASTLGQVTKTPTLVKNQITKSVYCFCQRDDYSHKDSQLHTRTASRIEFYRNYKLPKDPLVKDRERVDMTIHELWKTTAYRSTWVAHGISNIHTKFSFALFWQSQRPLKFEDGS